MRAIVVGGVDKNDPAYQRKRARASTQASAIDYGIHQGWTVEQFKAELGKSGKRGQPGGIEHLAELGRQARRSKQPKPPADNVTKALSNLKDEEGFRASGNLGGTKAGYRLGVIKVPDGTEIADTRGWILDSLDDNCVQRVLQQWVKSREAGSQDKGTK